MKLRKVVVLFLVASMILSLTSCTRQTAAPQVEHTSEENDTVQENMMEENNVGEDNLPKEIFQKKDSLNESSMDESSEKEFVQSNEESETIDKEENGQQTPSVNHKTEENKPSEEAKSEESSDTLSEKEEEILSESEKKEMFHQYIEPYYILGLMYDNWDSPEEISADRLIKFYTYNCLESFLEKTEQKDPGYLSSHSEVLVPESDVESFITSYFKVDEEYLHTAQSYQPDTKSYLFSTTVGVGGGPMEIIRIEKDEKNWKFICQDAEGTELSVTIEMVNEDQFYYVAGN